MNKRFYALGRMKKGKKNQTEQAFDDYLAAEKLAGRVYWYAFEKVKLQLADNCFLTVDFFVMLEDRRLQAIDVKGSKYIIQDDARVKMKVAAEEFPFEFYYAIPRTKKSGGGWEMVEV